jgi:hypothetical protein
MSVFQQTPCVWNPTPLAGTEWAMSRRRRRRRGTLERPDEALVGVWISGFAPRLDVHSRAPTTSAMEANGPDSTGSELRTFFPGEIPSQFRATCARKRDLATEQARRLVFKPSGRGDRDGLCLSESHWGGGGARGASKVLPPVRHTHERLRSV